MHEKKNQHALVREFSAYVLPGVLGMLGLSCYILADTFFIARGLGANGLTALNLAIPIYSFISGCGLMLGTGGGIRYSIFKGQNEAEGANRVFFHTVLLTGLCSVLFVLAGLLLPGTLTRLMGADGAVFAMTEVYMRVVLLFAPAFILNNVLLAFVRNDGGPGLAMLAMLGGSFSNVILDYIFIFPLDMGIFGAVLATGFAPLISMATLSAHFIKKRNGFRLRKYEFSPKLSRAILSGGLPSLVTEVSSGVVIIVFNMLILGLRGNVGVAAYGVIANLSLVVIAIYTGVGQGVQPLISRYYGQGGGAEIKRLLRYALTVVAAISAAVYAAVFFGADAITALFNSEGNETLQAIAAQGMTIYFTGCLFAGLNIVLSAYAASVDSPRPAQAISLLRGFLVIIPVAVVLARLLGMTGVWLAFPVTECAVLAVAAGSLLRGVGAGASAVNPR